MSILDTLVAEKIKRNAEKRQSEAIFDVIQIKIAEDQGKSGKTPEDIKAFGEKIDKVAKIGFSPNEAVQIGKMISPELFRDQTPVNIFMQGNDGSLQKTGQVSGRDKVFKQALTADEMADRSSASTRAKEEVMLDYPDLDEKGKSAVSAFKFISPRIEKLNQLIDGGIFGQGGAERLTKQIIATPGGELIVPDGSPLEELTGLYNDIKLTGFNIAGTAFTGTEKETAFSLLDPRGKSDKRIKRDLSSFQDLFGTRIQSAVGGLREAKETAKEISSKKSEDDGYEYKKVGNKLMRRKKKSA